MLGATGANRLLYGALFLMSILLYRNYFYRSAGANTALSHFAVLVLVSAVGYGCAAFITPGLLSIIGLADVVKASQDAGKGTLRFFFRLRCVVGR